MGALLFITFIVGGRSRIGKVIFPSAPNRFRANEPSSNPLWGPRAEKRNLLNSKGSFSKRLAPRFGIRTAENSSSGRGRPSARYPITCAATNAPHPRQRAHVTELQQRPLPAAGLAPHHRDGRNALHGEGEEYQQRHRAPRREVVADGLFQVELFGPRPGLRS